MNYRHVFHAGNFADVVKHIVLIQCLIQLKKKPAPFRVIDTHAGRGVYDLAGADAQRTGEAEAGVVRVLAALPKAPPAVKIALAPWVDAVRRRQPSGSLDGRLAVYPGSPALIADELRADDTLYAVERQPDERARLADLFARDRRVKVPDLDGWLAVKSLLPPAERRGLVMIDPPYEAPGDLQRLAASLDDGLSRFKSGIFLLWYPIKDIKPVERMRRRIADLVATHGIETALDVELLKRAPRHPEILSGAGLLVINAPYQLERELAAPQAWLGSVFAETTDGEGQIRAVGRR